MVSFTSLRARSHPGMAPQRAPPRKPMARTKGSRNQAGAPGQRNAPAEPSQAPM